MRDERRNRQTDHRTCGGFKGGKGIARFLQKFLYPPVKRDDVTGYGQTITQRHPSITSEEIQALDTRDPGSATMMAVALLTGILTGVAAYLLKWGIATFSKFVTGCFKADSLNWWLILLPVAGLILVGIYQRYVIHQEISHGDDRLRQDFLRDRCYLPLSITYNPILACIITLGFGGSAGSEGPVAYSGAAIGSNIGSLFRISPEIGRAHV